MKKMPTLSEYKMQEPDQNQVETPENKEEIQGDLVEESLEDDLGVEVPDIPLPSADELEDAVMPSSEQIVQNIKNLVD